MQLRHVLSRGVDKRKIFLDDQDRFRFIHDLFEFNDVEPANNLTYFFRQSRDIASPYIKKGRRKNLVSIHAFCIMPNHYHLLLSPATKDGISWFMKKLNIGYAKYFNKKYNRTGTLFEGRYKSIIVDNEAHFIHLPYYVHLNPLDLFFPEWRDRELKNLEKALKFLETYRWSSHLDYMGYKNFPSITKRDFLLRFFGGPNEYKKSIYEWLKDLDLTDIHKSLLEF